MSELLSAAGDLGPWFIALVLLVLLSVYVLEKLGGKDGPITRALAAISNRELNRLRREGEVEVERQRLAALTESRAVTRLRRRLSEAYTELDEMESTIDWLLRDRNDQRRRDRMRAQFDQQLIEWLDVVFEAAAAAGLSLPAPPRPPQLGDLIVLDEDLPEDHPPLRTRSSTRRRQHLEADEEDEDWALGDEAPRVRSHR